jgi:nitronate monooxygenase
MVAVAACRVHNEPSQPPEVGWPDAPHEPAPPMVGTTGQIEPLSLWAGQSVALATQTQPAAEIVAELVSQM